MVNNLSSMRPATRSHVGISKDVVGRSSDGEAASSPIHAQHKIDDVQVDVASSSSDSEDTGVLAGRGGDRRVLGSHLSPKTGDSVATKVFDGMPQLASAALEKNRGSVSDVVGTKQGTASDIRGPWVNLFKDNRNLGQGIKLNMVDSAEDMLHLKDEDVDNVAEIWGYCLVGLFSGRFPGMDAVRTIREGWKVECHHWIHRSGWIIFKFKTEEDRLTVLNGGPYFIYGRSLMLKNMPRCFRFGGAEFATVPVWVQLPDLPLDCWNARALSKIVSRIGKPITTDKMTLTKERLSFARVMVEVDASKELVSSLEIKLPTGDIYNQLVVYEVTPKYCKNCKVFGHIDGDCSKVLDGTKQAAYVPRRMNRPGGVAMPKKGETSRNMSSGKDTSMGAQAVNRDVVTHEDGLIGGSQPGKSSTEPRMLPGKSVLTADSSEMPEQSDKRPVDAGLHRIPEASLGHAGTRDKQKLDSAIRSDVAASLLSEEVGHGSSPNLEESSIQPRKSVPEGGKEKETEVVPHGRQVAVRENRKLTAKGLSFASISKGKAKGKPLQLSK